MNKRKKIIGIIAPVATFILIFAFWETIVTVKGIPKWLLPKPSDIFSAMIFSFSDFWPHILATIQTIMLGFILAIPVGLILASLITSFPLLNKAMSPYITFLVTTPLISLVPLLMLVMGYGMNMRVLAVVIQSFAVINMNACTGFNNVPVIRHELMSSLGAGRIEAYRRVILPSAASDIFTGVRLAGIFATTACISVEYVGGNTGLGSQIIKYSQFLKTTESFACIFYVTIIGLILYALISLAQKKIISWQI